MGEFSSGFRWVRHVPAVCFTLIVCFHCCEGQTQGKVTIRPNPTVYVRPGSQHFLGLVVVTCDGRDNAAVESITLEVSQGSTVVSETVDGTKDEADVNDFHGSLAAKNLNYTLLDPDCDKNGLVFKCTVTSGGVDNSTNAYFYIRANDGEVHIQPKSKLSLQRTVGQTVRISCWAILSGKPTEDQVEWEWTKKDEGEQIFSPVEEEVQKRITTSAPKDLECNTVNSSSVLVQVLQPFDHRRVYRCAYKNKVEDDEAEVNLGTAKVFHFGSVRVFNDGVTEPTIVTWTQTSFVGMICGIASLVMVSFLALLYIYRKNRGGKKYDIVTALLAQEEEELAKIEERLDIKPAGGASEAAIGGAASTTGIESEASSAAPEEDSEAGSEAGD